MRPLVRPATLTLAGGVLNVDEWVSEIRHLFLDRFSLGNFSGGLLVCPSPLGPLPTREVTEGGCPASAVAGYGVSWSWSHVSSQGVPHFRGIGCDFRSRSACAGDLLSGGGEMCSNGFDGDRQLSR